MILLGNILLWWSIRSILSVWPSYCRDITNQPGHWQERRMSRLADLSTQAAHHASLHHHDSPTTAIVFCVFLIFWLYMGTVAATLWLSENSAQTIGLPFEYLMSWYLENLH